MTFALTRRGALENTSSRLELEYAEWTGTWEEFLAHVRERGDHDEIDVLELVPQEFAAMAATRRQRVKVWGDNRLSGLLENMHSLATRASKKLGEDTVPDNNVRLSATKFLLEQILEKTPVVTPTPGTPLSGNLGDAQGRLEEIDEELKKRGGKLTETTTTVERAVEVNGAAEE